MYCLPISVLSCIDDGRFIILYLISNKEIVLKKVPRAHDPNTIRKKEGKKQEKNIK